MMHHVTRREFLSTTAVGAASAAAGPWVSRARAQGGPIKIGVGLIAFFLALPVMTALMSDVFGGIGRDLNGLMRAGIGRLGFVANLLAADHLLDLAGEDGLADGA